MISSILYIISLLLPLTTWCLIKKYKRIDSRKFTFITMTIIIGSGTHVTNAYIVGKQYHQELLEFERTYGNRLSLDEMTPEHRQAIDNYTHDTGRLFAPIVAIPMNSIWLLLNFMCLNILYWVYKKIKTRTNDDPIVE